MREAPNDINTDNAIIPKHYGNINTFKIGGYFYIPVKIIPVVYRKAFKLKPIKKVVSSNTIHPVH